jgi:potassium/chloride transporter 4/5/6
VLLKQADESVATVIQRESAEAEVVLLGLATPPIGEEADYAQRLETLVGDLPSVFFVKNGSLFIGELITQEEEEEAPLKADAPTSA